MRIGPPVTPDVIKGLLIGNVAIYLLQMYAGITDDLVVRPIDVWENQKVWQTFTYMWAHGGLWHLGGNMLMLWMFGSEVAAHWGTKRFLSFYMASGIGAGVIIATYPAFFYAMDPTSASYFTATLGASGAVYAVLLAHSLMWPDKTLMLIFPPIPLKALYLIPLLFLMELLSQRTGVSHVGHLGGVAVGWFLLWRMGITRAISLDQLKLRYRRYKMRRNLRIVQEEELKDRRERNDAARERRRQERDRDGGWMH
jgi:membrane associated rhomboid family serine protease